MSGNINFIKNIKGYKNLTNDQLMECFKSNNWQTLKKSNRISLLQEVENRNANSQGRNPCKVRSQHEKNLYGYHDNYNKVIGVNVDDTIKVNENGVTKRIPNSSYNTLHTIYHEGRHDLQHEDVNNNPNLKEHLSEQTKDLCEIEYVEGNYPYEQNGIRKGNIDYSRCACEIDANNAAINQIMESKEIFRDDPEFKNFLDEQQKEFEKVNNTDVSLMCSEENIAIDHAYDEGYINQDRCDYLKLNVGNNTNKDVLKDAENNLKKIKEEQNYLNEEKNSNNEDRTKKNSEKEIDKLDNEYESASAHSFDENYTLNHPNEDNGFDNTETVSQDIIDKNTAYYEKTGNDFFDINNTNYDGSAKNGDSEFFYSVDNKNLNTDTSNNEEFFENVESNQLNNTDNASSYENTQSNSENNQSSGESNSNSMSR